MGCNLFFIRFRPQKFRENTPVRSLDLHLINRFLPQISFTLRLQDGRSRPEVPPGRGTIKPSNLEANDVKMTPIISAAAALFVSTAALASDAGFASADANKDGKVTLKELAEIMPGASKDSFKVADADGDGALSVKEFEVLIKM